MMTGSVLDILIYVFDRYMLDDSTEVPEREHLARDLEHVGFDAANVERALDWLTDLAFGHERPRLPQRTPASPDCGCSPTASCARLSTECRGLSAEPGAARHPRRAAA